MFYSIVLFLLPSIVIHFLTPFTVKMEWTHAVIKFGTKRKEKCENEEIGLAMGERGSGFSFVFSCLV